MNEVRFRRTELCRIAQWLAIGLLLGGPASSRSSDASAPAGRFATLIEMDGPIGPALSHYVEHVARGRRQPAQFRSYPANGHARRTRHLHARYHQGDSCLACAGGDLCGTERCAGGKRGNLHPLCEPSRRDGSGDQSRCRNTDFDWRRAELSPPRQTRPTTRSKKHPMNLSCRHRRASVKRSMMPSRTSVRWRSYEAAMPTGRKPPCANAASLLG